MNEHDPDALLGHLAASGWFAQNGEVALTSGLAFCLNKDQIATAALVELVRRRIVAEPILVPDRWQAEWVDENRMRPDVVGWSDRDGHRVPSVVLEAKVSAAFGNQQISYYARHQQAQLAQSAISTGALVVLVPHDRVDTARHEVGLDLGIQATQRGSFWTLDGDATVHITVVSWSEALSAMHQAAGPAADDIRQLAAAVAQALLDTINSRA